MRITHTEKLDFRTPELKNHRTIADKELENLVQNYGTAEPKNCSAKEKTHNTMLSSETGTLQRHNRATEESPQN